MKRMLTACKIYNECPSIIFSILLVFPVASFSFSERILRRMSLSLILLVDFFRKAAQTELLKSFINGTFVQTPMNKNSTKQLFCC